MEDALDFIGWYNDKTHKQLGISKWNTRALYLAYHEGRGGYKRGSYKSKAGLQKIADKVKRTADDYGSQLKQCEARFQCRNGMRFGHCAARLDIFLRCEYLTTPTQTITFGA